MPVLPDPKHDAMDGKSQTSESAELLDLIRRKAEENAIRLFDETGCKPTPMFQSWLDD